MHLCVLAKLLDLKRVDTWDRQETMTLVAGEVASMQVECLLAGPE